jgi:DNA-binding GntR family transcriptional regulator
MSPVPKYDLIVSVLRARIAGGTYPAGPHLPTQRDLASKHGTPVTPVRDAGTADQQCAGGSWPSPG